MVQRGELTREQAGTHPHKNLITRALGPDISADCDGTYADERRGVSAAVSDGLVNTVTDQEMLFEVIRRGRAGHLPGPAAGHRQAPGAPDNVTAS